MVHVTTLEAETSIYPARVAQIAALQWDKAPIKIFFEDADFDNLFSLELAMKLPENTGINEYIIELIKRKQLLYWSIYTRNSVELETLKTYIETHLKIEFICPSKSSASTFILFDKKFDSNLH